MTRPAPLSLVCLVVAASGLATAFDWTPVDNVLLSAIENRTFPGCAAAVTTADGSVVLLRAYGTFVYDDETTPGAQQLEVEWLRWCAIQLPVLGRLQLVETTRVLQQTLSLIWLP